MIDRINSKLNNVLSSGAWCEITVTYIFVQMRKILEASESTETFKHINFYANWVLHSKLERKEARDYLGRLNRIFSEKKTLFVDIPVVEEVKTYISFAELKSEINSFLTQNNLPKDIVKPENWEAFLGSLLNTLADSPLIIKDNNTLIKSFTFRQQIGPKDVIFEIDLKNHCSYYSVTDFDTLNN